MININFSDIIIDNVKEDRLQMIEPFTVSIVENLISIEIERLKNSVKYFSSDTLHKAIELRTDWHSLVQAYELYWDNSIMSYDIYYHFLYPRHIEDSPVSIYTLKKKYSSPFKKNQWDDALLEWKNLFEKPMNIQIITLKKARLLKVKDLKELIKIDKCSSFFIGQNIQWNDLYFTNNIVTYCLPLKQIIGRRDANVRFNPEKDQFDFSYSIERRAAGKGWTETKIYEGSINSNTWEKEEEMVESYKTKWD